MAGLEAPRHASGGKFGAGLTPPFFDEALQYIGQLCYHGVCELDTGTPG